jgi:phosphocarrier protein
VSDGLRFEAQFVVRSSYGLHARPAARFAQLAAELGCEIVVGRPGAEEWVNGASVLSILSLAASQGTTLVVRAEGANAGEAVRQLGAILEDADSP